MHRRRLVLDIICLRIFSFPQDVNVGLKAVLLIVGLVVLAMPSDKANATHFSIVESGIYNIRLFGIIEEEYLASLTQLSSQFPESEDLILCLNSAGGS